MDIKDRIDLHVSIPLKWLKLSPRWKNWLPTPGNVVFTLLVVIALFWTSTVKAFPWINTTAAAGTSTGTWPYQGRLADSAGNPITNVLPMTFRIYSASQGGAVLWEEEWDSVQVSDGLFNVMLGSLTPIQLSMVNEYSSLWLGITVGTDTEMTPRVQLGSVPFAAQALTVPDGSISAAKIADGSITTAKIADGAISAVKVADGSIATEKFSDGSIISEKIADGGVRSRNIAFSRYEDFAKVKTTNDSATIKSTGVKVTFFCDTSCTAEIIHRGLAMHTIVNGRVDVYIRVDGTTTILTELGYAIGAFANLQGSGFVNLAPGTHTVEVMFACSNDTPGGVCTYYGDGTGYWDHLDVLLFAQPQ